MENINNNISVINYHNLPCLLIDDYGVIFSYVNNKFVCVKIPIRDINNNEIYKKASEHGFFKWIEIGNVEHEDKQLTLSITERCNCHCKYCFLDANTTGKVMTKDTLHAAIDYAFNFYSDHKIIINAFGGEPTTQFELIKEMVKYANSQKEKYSVTPHFAITTNGVLSDEIIDFLIINNFDCSVSIDGTEGIQNRQRPLANGESSFSQAYHTLQRLTNSGCFVRVRSTVTKFSVSKMVDAVNLFGSIGVKQVHFEPVTLAGRAENLPDELLPPTLDDYVSMLIACIEKAKQYDTHINFSIFSHCNGSIQNKMIVGASGMISACVEVQNHQHSLSSIFCMGSIENAKVNITKNNIKDTLFDNPSIQEKCKRCPYLLFCANSCPVRNYRATNNIWHTEPFKCELYHRIMPYILNEFYRSTYDLE